MKLTWHDWAQIDPLAPYSDEDLEAMSLTDLANLSGTTVSRLSHLVNTRGMCRRDAAKRARSAMQKAALARGARVGQSGAGGDE